ncbi:MAG: Holliday junction resolvase RecU [Sarcina sp.]
MKKNPGKLFEIDFKMSVPSWCWPYRLKDGTANFQGSKNENVRFQAHNICDFIVMGKNYLYLLELKSTAGNSIPFGNFRQSQVKEMDKINKEKVKAYFVINYRKSNKTYALDAHVVKDYIDNANRKSIPIDFAKNHGIEINSSIKRVRYEYDLENFFE